MSVFYLNAMALNLVTPLAAWPWAESSFEAHWSATKNKSRILPPDRWTYIAPLLKYHSICQIFPHRDAPYFPFFPDCKEHWINWAYLSAEWRENLAEQNGRDQLKLSSLTIKTQGLGHMEFLWCMIAQNSRGEKCF